jgi:transposase
VATRTALPLGDQQSSELSEMAPSRSLPAGYVLRARLILMLAQGASFNAIKQRLGTTSAPTIIRWKERFLAAGIDGLDTQTGKVVGKTAARHTSQEFVGFLAQVVAEGRHRQEILIILDNLSAHKTQAVRARGIFTSVRDLARKLRRYMHAYSANARPIQWKYSAPSRRLRTNVVSAKGHSMAIL